ncbi:ABC transporter permease [Bacillus sp. 03113]|uniref:ABC transporter permease n=1 Tax=Bacillus sp. 03113 TaxID=2578211 RepID=UPI00114402FB|nr:ABC transporter permease [Bacillus sp. 03113]
MKQISQRVASTFIVIFGSLFIVFSMNYFLPGDAVDQMMAGNDASPEAAKMLRQELGLDLPFHTQFMNYLTNLIHGDFGQSIISHEPVIDKILTQLPATIQLTLSSAGIALLIGIFIGVLSAIHHNTLFDHLARILSLIGTSMPTFWSGILLILIFSVHLKWFPSMGSNGWKTLVLPAITLGLYGAGYIIRMVRNSTLEVINEPFILTLRSKGLPERFVMYRHALRNALIPAITMIGVIIGELLGGAVITESVFSRQGIGRLVADAIVAKDLPVIQGVVFFTALIYVLMNLMIDISYTFIDPRIRRVQQGGAKI